MDQAAEIIGVPHGALSHSRKEWKAQLRADPELWQTLKMSFEKIDRLSKGSKIGLETVPESGQYGYFRSVHDYAKRKGHSVVRLSTKGSYRRLYALRAVLDLFKESLEALKENNGRKKEIGNRLSQGLRKIATEYRMPSLKNIAFKDWAVKWIMYSGALSNQMAMKILKEKPALAFIGGGHALDLKDLSNMDVLIHPAHEREAGQRMRQMMLLLGRRDYSGLMGRVYSRRAKSISKLR
ncbi:MAG: hypothetical protein ABIG96_02340 [Candidatus Micrarchaeota archaeon]